MQHHLWCFLTHEIRTTCQYRALVAQFRAFDCRRKGSTFNFFSKPNSLWEEPDEWQRGAWINTVNKLPLFANAYMKTHFLFLLNNVIWLGLIFFIQAISGQKILSWALQHSSSTSLLFCTIYKSHKSIINIEKRDI